MCTLGIEDLVYGDCTKSYVDVSFFSFVPLPLFHSIFLSHKTGKIGGMERGISGYFLNSCLNNTTSFSLFFLRGGLVLFFFFSRVCSIFFFFFFFFFSLWISSTTKGGISLFGVSNESEDTGDVHRRKEGSTEGWEEYRMRVGDWQTGFFIFHFFWKFVLLSKRWFTTFAWALAWGMEHGQWGGGFLLCTKGGGM